VNLKYKDEHSVMVLMEHLSNFQGLLNKRSTMKLTLDNEVQALLVLSSLLSNSALNGVITIDMVKDNMFNEKARRK
jgi:hypothetical protein